MKFLVKIILETILSLIGLSEKLRNLNQFNHATDILYFYSKNDNYEFNETLIIRVCSFCGAEKDPEWRGMHSPGLRNSMYITSITNILI